MILECGAKRGDKKVHLLHINIDLTEHRGINELIILIFHGFKQR